MGVDVDRVLAQYENAANDEPMHGQAGQVRRNPSTDQKKARRRQDEVRLLRTAASTDNAAEQRQALAELEALRTEAMREQDEERALDLTAARINDTLVPGHVHELHTVSTDWLLDIPAHTASQQDAEHALIAEAVLWYGRVDKVIKADTPEFAEQARNKARYVASQYGDHADSAAQAFVTESERLRGQDVKMGRLVIANDGVVDGDESPPRQDPTDADAHTASLQHTAMQIHNLDDPNGGMSEGPDDLSYDPESKTFEQGGVAHAPDVTQEPGDKPVATEPNRVVQHPQHAHPMKSGLPHLLRQVLLPDSSGVREMAEQFADYQLHAHSNLGYAEHLVARSASLSREPDRFPEEDGELSKTAAAGPPISAMDGSANLPSPPPYEADTSSNRAPALQEMEGYDGFSGTSVVPDSTGQSESMNNQGNTNDDRANPPSGFPVSGSHTTKESSVDHAQCPTCGGLGKVAVRKQAYSGLPQVDQIVNADESPGETPYPTEVAWPLVGWDPNNINKAIQETEGQIANRPGGLPGPPGAPGRKGASVHQGAGDDSGWAGDQGARGPNYPGYSAPTGYDGSSNLGQPDPVYGYGGDQAPGPKKPYGFDEANDFTNNPGEPYDPSSPHNNDAGQSSVSQSETTGGMGQTTGSRDPFIASAQEEIARQMDLINTRSAMLARQGQ